MTTRPSASSWSCGSSSTTSRRSRRGSRRTPSALAVQEHPDALVLDVMMPGMDGFEVCRRLRTSGAESQPVVVMLSARDSAESMQTGLDAGADDYILKPPDLDELVERVQSRLRQRATGSAA